MKYLRSITALGCKDIGIRKSDFVANTQFLWTKEIKLKISPSLRAVFNIQGEPDKNWDSQNREIFFIRKFTAFIA